VKFFAPRPFADPDVTARKLVEIANGVESAQDKGRPILPMRFPAEPLGL
jgi:hypothetical protein